MTNKVYTWIEENEPVDQDKLVEEFGRRGLADLRELMEKRKVSYNLEYNLQTEK